MVKAHKKSYLGKVLFVEDNELFGVNLQKQLEKFNVDCDWTPEFSDAKRKLNEETYHALITDVYDAENKPQGLELVKIANGTGIPTIIITSHADLEVAKEALNNGADHFIEKPFEAKDLMTILKDIWENPRGLIARRERYLENNALTNREKELTRLILKGLTNKEIADVSGITMATVKFYTNQIFEKCEVKSRAELFNTIFPT